VKIFAKIRFYWGLLVIAVVAGLMMIPLIAIFRKQKGIIIHRLNRLVIFLLGGKIHSKGTMDSNVDMFLLNHQSVCDIIAMEALQKNHLRWVAKQELFEMFYLGNLLKIGDMIGVKREDKRGLLKLLQEAQYSRQTLKRPIAIFPEGTRAKGQKLLSFKQGAKIIAEKLDFRIQPVVITGSKTLLDEHKKVSQSSDIHIEFLPPIDVKDAPNSWYEDLQKEMQKIIDDALTNHNRSR